MAKLIKYVRKGLAETPSSPILKFSDYASKIPDVVKFTLGEPDFNTPDHIKEAAKRSIDENHSHYAPSNGTMSLRKAASQFLSKKYNQNYDPETEVLVTTGVTESIFDAVLATLNSGDVMVVPTPIFPLYMT
ncbi:MAG: aminotransferase class I/II-fold pyridoxal phosphate-dependent enzyme, partial [Lactobacillus sp.]|nr:aminotransferase class I/II-fold pyridoxal phosphate-dependent enzyme [Lactobacillus sp.]